MVDLSGIDWNDAFANGAYIPDGMSYPPRWATQAADFRDRAAGQPDLSYGDDPRERYDLFLPEAHPKGLVVFVHGGYWLDFDKSSWSHLAGGPLHHGWAVALPSYTLAPAATIPQITAQIGRAITIAATHISGPIRLVGHSAGGHLVSRMACDDTPLPDSVASRVQHVLSISGLHDLRPLQMTEMNAQLGLDRESAASESAALHKPLPGTKLTAWVGGNERPEFLRQSALLVENWTRAGAIGTLAVEPARHHFNVIDGLADPDSAMTQQLLA
ncbi:alpha/beta hydrolase [Primorskyibacter sp. S87]|uniref:alpha/beta hydrolase n=1 Tax=Primorskyibacter sp. S87 TaxID=3415126 RepID=UPI003C7D10DF